MSTIATLSPGQAGDTSRTDINSNFANLNADKMETSAYLPATTALLGKAKASYAPVDAANPIFLGENDPRVLTTAEKARIPSVNTAAAEAGTSGTPSAINPFATKETTDALSASIASSIANSSNFTAWSAITSGNALHVSPYAQTDGGIVHDASTATWYSATTNQTMSHTVANQSNRALFVGVYATSIPTLVTYNSVTMTFVDSQANDNASGTLFIYKLAAPATGANNVSVTATGINGISASSFYNVHQTNLVEAIAKTNGAGVFGLSTSITTISQGAFLYGMLGLTGAGSPTSPSASFTSKYSSSVTGANATTGSVSITVANSGIKLNEVQAQTFTLNSGAGGGSPHGAMILISMAPATAPALGVLPAVTTLSTVNEPLIDFIGFAKATVAIWATVSVQTSGIVTGLSGLTAGLKYYLTSSSGALSTTRGVYGKLVGVALSSTTLLIAPEKTTGSNIAKTTVYTYTAECDGTVVIKCSGSNTITTDGIVFTGLLNSVMSIPVSRKKTYIISTGATDTYFIPQA